MRGNNGCFRAAQDRGVAELLVLFIDKRLVWPAVYVCGHVVGFLRGKAVRIGFWHIVLDKRRHFRNVIHPRPIVIGIRPPHRGNRGRISSTFRTVAKRTL